MPFARTIVILTCLMVCGCVTSDVDLNLTLPAAHPFPSGQYKDDKGKIINVTRHENIYSIDKGRLAIMSIPESSDIFIAEILDPEAVGKNYYFFIAMDSSTGKITTYDLKPKNIWLLSKELVSLVPTSDLQSDGWAMKINGSDIGRFLRTVVKNRVLSDPDVDRTTYTPLTPPAAQASTQSADSSAVEHPNIIQNPRPGKRIALVIGNAKYENVAALSNPARDARAVGDALRSNGFEVTMWTDLGHDQLLKALNTFSRDAAEADWALVYFAGHGLEVGGTTYIIPTDASLDTDTSLVFEAVPLGQVMASVERSKTLRIVIVDACRSNPFKGRMRYSVATRSSDRGLGRPPEPDPGELVIYAAKEGEVAADGNANGNSPFATALVRRLRTPNLEVRRLFDFVRDDVLAMTDRKQHPFTYGSLSAARDYYFSRAN